MIDSSSILRMLPPLVSFLSYIARCYFCMFGGDCMLLDATAVLLCNKFDLSNSIIVERSDGLCSLINY
ncbi:unnamed protein product [Musa hybrid cultivar]